MGYLAEHVLTAAAQAEVCRLVGPAGLPPVAGWADEMRQTRRDTAAWHYVDTEITAAGYAARMADPGLPRAERQDALKFVVHVVGDLRQPLHACDAADRAGNAVRVRLAQSNAANLHAVWDSAAVAALGPDAPTIGTALVAKARGLPPAERAALARGDPVDWAAESWLICRDEVYAEFAGGRLPPGGTRDKVLGLPDDHAAAHAALAGDRLLRAGLRLAALLNARFKAAPR